MSYYFIAQIRIDDTVEYQKYLDHAGEIFKRYKGEYLMVENDPVVLEGQWDCTRTVLIRFNNTADFYDWYNSVEYQTILKHRLKGAECNTILAKGLNHTD